MNFIIYSDIIQNIIGQNERPIGPTDGLSQPSQKINLPPASEHLTSFHVAVKTVPSPDHKANEIFSGNDGNEDIYAIEKESRTVFVGDGMGGEGSGGYFASRRASEIIMDTLRENDKLPTQDLDMIKGRLEESVRAAHRVVKVERPGEGTTASLAREVILADGSKKLVWANVGDSSIRVFRDGRLIPISKAHSVQRLARESKVLPPEIPEYFRITTDETLQEVNDELEQTNRPRDFLNHDLSAFLQFYFSYRNKITSQVGIKEEIDIDLGIFDLQQGDIVVMFTDGVDDTLTRDEITEVIANANSNIDSIPAALIAAAQLKCADAKEIWDANFAGKHGRAKPDDITVAAWKA